MTVKPPTYRERLRVEGLVLAAAGALSSALLLAGVPKASDRASSTIGQLAGVTLLLAVFAPLVARRTLARARPAEPGEQLTGEPTALWKPPLVLVVLATPFVVAGELGVEGAGWDAGLRVAGGCLLVGLAQALLVERIVAADEARTGRTYVRLPGSSASRGTTLGFFRHERV
jgi:hypothetical protein